MTFHDDEHRINNTGWIAKWWWNGGVERKAKPLRKCWTFFNLHFPASEMEAMSRICACKTEKNLQIFGWCLQFKQSCLRARQENQCNEASRLWKCIKKSSALSHTKMWRSLLANWVCYIAAKNHDLFVKQERKGNWWNKENAATGW
jgi:hypothetical protein